MKILLTGASGFIGTHFIHATSHEITPFSFHQGNIDTLNLSAFDAVLHLAALVHQMEGADPEAYEQINHVRTLELATRAKEAAVKHFLFMSTVKVYGEESDAVYTETTPCHPQDPYGMSKRRAEEDLLKLSDEHFTVSIIRTPIVYGSGVKANIHNLVMLIKNVPILPFGDTKNRRSMVYVGNLCALIESVLKQHAEGIFLASDDTALSTTEFVREITKGLGKKRYLITLPMFEDLLKRFKPSFYQRLYGNLSVDNRETKERLGFHNPYTTEEGIKHMLQENPL